MMNDISQGTVPVPLTSEGVAEGKAVADAAAAQPFLKNDPATMQKDAAAESPSIGFASAATMPVSDDPSNQMKEAASAAISSHSQEGEELHQPLSSGGIAFLTSLSAEALQEFDMPEYVKRHNATLTFPEKLMIMLTHVEKVYAKGGKRIDSSPVEWVQDGMVVYIRDKNKLAKDWLPLFFQQTKFSRHVAFRSFTRKLYRWGFRQYSSPGETANKSPTSMYFFNENFRRDDHSLLPRMRSVTAAGTRREEAVAMAARRRTEDVTAPRVPANNDLLVQMLLQPSAALPVLGLQPNLTQAALVNAAISQMAQAPSSSQPALTQAPATENTNHLLQQLLMLSQLARPQQDLQSQGLAALLASQGATEQSALQQRLSALLGQRESSASLDLQTLGAQLQQLQQQQMPQPQQPLMSSLLSGLSVPNSSLQDRLSRALLLQQLQQSQPQPSVAGGDQHSQMAAIMELLAQQNHQMPQFPPHSLPPRPPSE